MNIFTFKKVGLDREQLMDRKFHIQVRAVDKGVPQREGGNMLILLYLTVRNISSLEKCSIDD